MRGTHRLMHTPTVVAASRDVRRASDGAALRRRAAVAILLPILMLLFVAATRAASSTQSARRAAVGRADRVDTLVRDLMRRRHVPGLALAVVRDGRPVKTVGYGLANVELNVAVTPETVFEIGSITKQLTAAAVLLLVEEGKVSLDDPISKHLAGLPEAWSMVTVRHLLTHTSGIKNYTGLAGFELTRRLKREEFIKAISVHPLNFAPGEQWSYGNTAFNLLGHIIEQASGRPYWEFVTARIYKPLGMNSTRDRDPRLIIRGRADGYEWEQGALVGRDYDLTDVFSAGATTSTVLDLAKWDAALYRDAPLARSLREEMWTPVRLNNGKTYPYGFGWNVLMFRGHRLVSHGGQTAGFSANISRYADDRLTVIVLTNLGDIGLAGEFARAVAKVYLPDISLRALKPQRDADPQNTSRLGKLLRDYTEGRRVDPELVTAGVLDFVNSGRGRETARRVASYGALSSFTFLEPDANAAAGQRASRYLAQFGTHTVLYRFIQTEDGKVAGMFLEEEE